MAKLISIIGLLLLLNHLNIVEGCQICYDQFEQKNCHSDQNNISSYTLHMSVHPHLDAFWIFDFESYYSPSPNQGNVRSYFASNRFNSVKEIFDTTLDVLLKSKNLRQNEKLTSQKAYRSFFNSQMGFFKRWYSELPIDKKNGVKQILKTKHWQILGGGYVEHDQGCAYYDDIIENFQTGLHFLKEQFQYFPRAAISADSFGHSQSTLAILAHLGVEGFFVERSDEHILLENKTQFLWKAKSANGRYYGALPTHIRWAIHGFEDQFIPGNIQQNFCQTKMPFINNLNRETQFLKRILKSNHVMRYFGHDFQRFDQYSYSVIEGMMQKFSMQKCKKVTAVYGNPTQYFMTLMGEVFNKVKPLATRQQDIMPIWDYDSGLYWTGYYTTDPYHKKLYRDAGRFLYAVRKAFTPSYLSDPNSQDHKQSYKLLEQFAETVSYLQHHDGISGTSKYDVMDKYQNVARLQIESIKKTVLQQMYEIEYPTNTNNPIFQCSLEGECHVPKDSKTDIYLKVFRTGQNDRIYEPIVVHLQQNQFYEPDCLYQIVCLCTGFPCPCDLYLFPSLSTYSLIRLKKVENSPKDAFLLRQFRNDEGQISYNKTHFIIKRNQKAYNIGYKRLNGDPTMRSYDHLSRYGDKVPRSFSIRSGKYALGNNIKTQASLSKIKKVYTMQTDMVCKYVILWARDQMKTVISIPKLKSNQLKVETYSSAETGKLQDLYLQINAPHIQNKNKFYTDSNGWLVMKRELYKHEDYQAFFSPEGFDNIDGNTYPMTAFAYISDENGDNKLSVNTDRPQGVIAYHPGTLWVNFDRLSSDDGKWVYENTYRSQFQKFVHYLTLQNKQNNERKIQKIYDQPLLIQGNSVNSDERVPTEQYQNSKLKMQWENKTGINRVKFQVKAWNDSSLLLRIQNLRDEENCLIELYSADKICTFLTSYYGNQIKFQSIYETNIAGNIRYEDFLKKKWNWNPIVNLTTQNDIFNKVFSETINLRPLEIRTFVLQGVKFDTQQCRGITELNYSNSIQRMMFDTSKAIPIRNQQAKDIQSRLTDYLLNGNHCQTPSPANNNNLKSDIKQVASDQISDIHSSQTSIKPSPFPNSFGPVKPVERKQNKKPNNVIERPEKIAVETQQVIQFIQPKQEQTKNPTNLNEVIPLDKKVQSLKALSKEQKKKYFEFLLERLKKEYKTIAQN